MESLRKRLRVPTRDKREVSVRIILVLILFLFRLDFANGQLSWTEKSMNDMAAQLAKKMPNMKNSPLLAAMPAERVSKAYLLNGRKAVYYKSPMGGGQMATITDLNQKKIYMVDFTNKTYREIPFFGADKAANPKAKQLLQIEHPEYFGLKLTGGTKTLEGRTCKEIESHTKSAGGASSAQKDSQKETDMTVLAWYCSPAPAELIKWNELSMKVFGLGIKDLGSSAEKIKIENQAEAVAWAKKSYDAEVTMTMPYKFTVSKENLSEKSFAKTLLEIPAGFTKK